MIVLVLGYDEEEHDLVVERLEEKQIRTVIPSLAGQLLIKATYYTCDFRRAGSRSSFEAVNRFGYFRGADRSSRSLTGSIS